MCEHAAGVTAVQESFGYVPSSAGREPQSVLVDVVASEGSSWVRVFARKRAALHRQWLGMNLDQRDPSLVAAILLFFLSVR